MSSPLENVAKRIDKALNEIKLATIEATAAANEDNSIAKDMVGEVYLVENQLEILAEFWGKQTQNS